MAYKALYRTYRPKDFNEVAGQEHITKTFRNALKSGKIAHAYLFSGPRGTGKTSIAKIIAKAVNCLKAPTDNPCNNCDVCRGIDDNTISDVIEIDAASNNSVDQVREIRDKVKYLPGVTKYKVYIIDEVHMLSQGAFNALLKTLEEPPKHVIFILATTEPHKIPATIHSRCQRFDFRGISIPEMTKRLDKIIDEEKIQIDSEAIKVIAESAEGGMRDAISLLDQVVSYSEEAVSIEDVHAIKGTVSNEKILVIAKSIAENDTVKSISLLDELIMDGKEPQRLVDNMIAFYRNMLMFKNVNTDDFEQLIYKNEEFQKLALNLSNNLVFYYIEVLNKALHDMRFTTNAKLYMELAIIKMIDKIEKQEIVFEDTLNDLRSEISSLRSEIKTINTQKPLENVVKNKEDVPESKVDTFSKKIINDSETEEPVVNEHLIKAKEVIVSTLYSKDDIEEEVPNTVEVENKILSSDLTEDNNVKSEEKDIFNTSLQEEKKVDNIVKYKTFDIRFVEDVLNNGDRELKIDMIKKWYDLDRFATVDDKPYTKMITEGRIVAANSKLIIIEYESAAVCNRLMKKDFKEKMKSLINKFYNSNLDYLALPKSVWEEKSQEFIKKWRNGDKDIKLTPIKNSELIEIEEIDDEIEDMTPDSVKEAINIFGSDNVKVKRGEN
ncbi:hypothetical protein CI105_01245 [Candidatus Izimaplasma bacterium ZiA1]|uniref:DNA polymerase III subunit gamma/tau n=1 Tax=Candidatus Izimoplasma sp. ZiA1 TaxID=2024899 RepID=UPI000BAA5B0B|nr:hypothetical protein CI105_01245 [Candidatus Izimaplasma bacterium ZiA1]